MTLRNIQAEWRHLWAWARSVSVLKDLPEAMHWDDDDGQLVHWDQQRIIRFEIVVVYTGNRRREEAKITMMLQTGSTITEELAVPAEVSTGALAAGRAA